MKRAELDLKGDASMPTGATPRHGEDPAPSRCYSNLDAEKKSCVLIRLSRTFRLRRDFAKGRRPPASRREFLSAIMKRATDVGANHSLGNRYLRPPPTSRTKHLLMSRCHSRPHQLGTDNSTRRRRLFERSSLQSVSSTTTAPCLEQ